MRFVAPTPLALALAALIAACAADATATHPSDAATDASGDVASADASDGAPASDTPSATDLATDTDTDVDTDIVTAPPPPDDAYPCVDAQYWPLSLASERYPMWVHYRPGEEAVAREVMDYLETSWRVQVDELGFTAPLPDGGDCGPDAWFDVFIWAGIEEAYVDIIDENPETPWDDYTSYLVIDPFGPYGGDLLNATVAHEFNHACQASDDWTGSATIFEMTATFVETVVFPDNDSTMSILGDFQSRPDWSLDRDDDYETWYMYAASLYLIFLHEHVFDGDASFAARMWKAMRRVPGNPPHFVAALEELLQEQAGLSFADSVITFARWRWYTGSRDEGAHFAHGARFPADALVPLAADVGPNAGVVEITPAPMMLGNGYVRVSSDTAEAFEVALQAPANGTVRWVVQALPGPAAGRDGEVLDLSEGAARVRFSSDGERVLVVTALPVEPYDPRQRTDQRFAVSLAISETDGQ